MMIRFDDLRGSAVQGLLAEHLAHMAEVSPPESCHALNLEALREPGITFWSAWEREELVGCGALKELDSRHGEIKSMRTAKTHLRKGVASRMLAHILEEAKRRGYRRVSLETGAMPYFEPARRLYGKFGFRACPPFAGYVESPNNVFMSKVLIRGDEAEYSINTDSTRFDLAMIHSFLEGSYWAKGIPREVVECSVQNSLSFGVFHCERQVGFGRVITDYATFGYIGDVFVIPEYRGRGLSKLLLQEMLAHPKLQGLRRLMLATQDAHGLYAQSGFKPLAQPENLMNIHRANIYSPQGLHFRTIP